MGTTSDKLTYLNTTKGKIKDVINMTGANITSETTFRNYATKLYDGYISVLKDKNTLLDNMPKGTSTGAITDAADLSVYEDKMSKKSTQDGTPTPENPVEVKTVKGYRNLFDKDNALIGYEINGSDGTVTANYGYYTSDFIPVKANENYYLQKEINIEGASNCFYDINHNFISTLRQNVGVITIPDNNNIAYMRFNGKIIQENVQLTEGTEELPYVPYGTNWIYTKVSNGTDTNYYTIPLNGNEIAGIGNYKDELIVDKNGKCWLNKKTGKVVLDGSGLASNITERDITTRAYIGNYDERMPDSFLSRGCLSNLLIQKNIYNDDIEGFYFAYSGKWVIIAVNKNIIGTTQESIKTYLDNNNFIAYYPLATPQLIDLNYTVDLTLFEGVNNISNSEDMDMEIKYIKESYE